MKRPKFYCFVSIYYFIIFFIYDRVFDEFVLHCRAEATELCNCVYFVCHCTLAQSTSTCCLYLSSPDQVQSIIELLKIRWDYRDTLIVF